MAAFRMRFEIEHFNETVGLATHSLPLIRLTLGPVISPLIRFDVRRAHLPCARCQEIRESSTFSDSYSAGARMERAGCMGERLVNDPYRLAPGGMEFPGGGSRSCASCKKSG